MRVGKGKGMRDPHLSQRPMMTLTTTNSSGNCLESGLTPWDEGQASQQNPLPGSKAKNMGIYASCC